MYLLVATLKIGATPMVIAVIVFLLVLAISMANTLRHSFAVDIIHARFLLHGIGTEKNSQVDGYSTPTCPVMKTIWDRETIISVLLMLMETEKMRLYMEP